MDPTFAVSRRTSVAIPPEKAEAGGNFWLRNTGNTDRSEWTYRHITVVKVTSINHIPKLQVVWAGQKCMHLVK